jgi:hypothetical protein
MTFGCELNQLAKFYWENILVNDEINGKVYVNVPVLLPTKKSSNNNIEEELKEYEDFKYEHIRVNLKYWEELHDLIRRIKEIDQTIPNWSFWVNVSDNISQGYIASNLRYI